jgi:putative ABC transport system permease protein
MMSPVLKRTLRIIMPDVRFAMRIVLRRPGIPIVLAALFALSVGLASGTWAVVDAMLLRPLPYRDDAAIIMVTEIHPQRGMMAVTPANFLDWSTRVRTIQDVTGVRVVDISIAGRGLPQRIEGSEVTERFFDLLGVPAALGRVLQTTDFHRRERVAVIGNQLWTSQFSADPHVIGNQVKIDGEPFTVVGVMPRNFRTTEKAEIWIPWVMSADERRERRFHLVGAMARLRERQTIADAQRELDALYRNLQIEYPSTTADWSARVVPLRQMLVGDSRRALTMLGAAVAVLATVAFINIASLLLAWLVTRRQEFLVRTAVGATAARIIRQLLTETLFWAVGGTIGGLVIATLFVRTFGHIAVSTTLPYDFEPSIDGRAIVATAVLLIVSVAAAALTPCILAVHRSTELVPRRTWTTGALGHRIAIAVQVALSIVLLSAAAGLLVGFDAIARAAPNTATATAFAMEISLAERRYYDGGRQARFFQELLTALGTRPEVRTVAAASYVPPGRIWGNVRFAIDGRATSTEAQTALASAVSPGAFRLLGIPLIRGRLIDERDTDRMPHVAVISAALARRYWPNVDPIGERLTLVGDGSSITIVGVVDSVRQPLSTDPRTELVLYLSYLQQPWSFMTLMVVPATEPRRMLMAVHEEVARLDPTQAIGAVRELTELRSEWLDQPRLRMGIVLLFGTSTLLLTLVGLYARVAYAAILRMREFAIRQALGARPSDAVRTLTAEAFGIVLAGTLIGLGLLSPVSAIIRGVIEAAPPLTFRLAAAVSLFFALVAVTSAYWPARRAGRIDPARLLRTE